MYEKLLSLRLSLERCFVPAALRPEDDYANMVLDDDLLLELDERPHSPLLLHLATGFPSALLCVLAAGVLAGALAGREVGLQLPSLPAAQAASIQGPAVHPGGHLQADRKQQLQELEIQALMQHRQVPPQPVPPPLAEWQAR